MGAVLVIHGTEWHAVCDTDFEYRDALVVCRALGFQDGKVLFGGGHFTVALQFYSHKLVQKLFHKLQNLFKFIDGF